MHHTYVVSTVGTSLLTNGADEQTRRLLWKTANLREPEYAEADRLAVQERAHAVRARLEAASDAEAQKLSAELNGALTRRAAGPEYSHYLLATDTHQGALTAELVRDRLRAAGCREVTIVPLERLNTRSQQDFSRGIDRVLEWCDQTLPALREQGGRIVFNLAGSFKSLQAYAQTIGMIYADETVYIFEGGDLLTIPRLPIAFDTAPMRRHAGLLARLAQYDVVAAAEAADLPDAYLDRDGDQVCLSAWGTLAWNANKREILGGALAAQPGIAYLPSFQADFQRLLPAARAACQEAIARAARLYAEGGVAKLRADGSLRYSAMKGHAGIDHFRVDRGDRITCTATAAGLELRHCGRHGIEQRP
ncbi:MAG TPA: hypothetical protein VKT77_05370 [Chthonomonadaceae bacterium]|nr:hypothetical protein [Chthonomonadaceae bacterium]